MKIFQKSQIFQNVYAQFRHIVKALLFKKKKTNHKICYSLGMLGAENKEMSKGNPVSSLTLTTEYHFFFNLHISPGW